MLTRRNKPAVQATGDDRRKSMSGMDRLLNELGLTNVKTDKDTATETQRLNMMSAAFKEKLAKEKKDDVIGQYSIGRYIKGDRKGVFDPNTFVEADLDANNVMGGHGGDKKTFMKLRGEVDL